MNFRDIYNRYNFFKSSNEPTVELQSITSPIAVDPSFSDVNFENALKDLNGDEQGIGGHFGNISYLSWISQAEHSKELRLAMYREMESNPYVAEGLDEIAYAGLNEDKDGNVIMLNIKNRNLDANENIADNLNSEFNYIINNVIKYNILYFITAYYIKTM